MTILSSYRRYSSLSGLGVLCIIEESSHEIATLGRVWKTLIEILWIDLVIAADGPGSGIRRIQFPGTERRYVGYVAWRGTVVEGRISEDTKKLFRTCLNYFIYKNGHILMSVQSLPHLRPSLARRHQPFLIRITDTSSRAKTAPLNRVNDSSTTSGTAITPPTPPSLQIS